MHFCYFSPKSPMFYSRVFKCIEKYSNNTLCNCTPCNLQKILNKTINIHELFEKLFVFRGYRPCLHAVLRPIPPFRVIENLLVKQVVVEKFWNFIACVIENFQHSIKIFIKMICKISGARGLLFQPFKMWLTLLKQRDEEFHNRLNFLSPLPSEEEKMALYSYL